MKKGKSMVLLLCVLGVFSFSACSQQSPQKAEETNQESKTQDSGTSYKFRLGTILPADHPNGLGANKFADLVKEKTNGKAIVEVYPASQLGSEKDLVDSVAMGTLDFAVAGVAEWAKRYAPIMIFEGPFIFRDREHLIKTYNSPVGQEVFNNLTRETKAQSLGLAYYGTRYVTTKKSGAKTPAELSGLKLRCPDQPLYVGVVRAMGATPTPMSLSEVYIGLQQGVVDGQENPAATIASMKFFEVQKYLIKTAHVISGVYFWTNAEKLKALPEDIQKAVTEAGKEAAEWTTTKAFQEEDKYMEDLKAKGMTIVEPDHEAFLKATDSLRKEYEGKWGKGLYEKIQEVK